MQNKLFRKGLVIGIMILFFGVSIISSVSGNTKNISNIEKISYFKDKVLRSNLMERIHNFRYKNLKSGQIEKFVPLLFGDSRGWTPTELVSSESTDDSELCSIAVDASGAAHVVWQDDTDYGGSGNDQDIFYKMKPSGGSWTTTEVVSSESSFESWDPSLAVESDGTVHVTWDHWNETSNDVYYKMKPSGGSWTDAEVITLDTYRSGLTSLAVESDGTVHVAMNGVSVPEEWDVYYMMKPSGGSWTDAEHVTYDSTGWASDPALDVGLDGSVHIVWYEWDGGDIFDVYYKMKPSGGSWTDAEAVTQTSTLSLDPSVVVDQDSNIHVTYHELTPDELADACYKMKPDGGEWSSADILSDHSECFFPPSITVESNGRIHVVFDEIDPDSSDIKIFYRNKPSGGSWSTIEMVNYDFPGESFESSIGVDLSGVVHVAWTGFIYNYKGDADIFYKTRIGENQPPNAPIIEGKTSGKVGTSYPYAFTSTDPDGDDISEYIINWGDGPDDIVTGPFTSGVPYTKYHKWNTGGPYTIKAKAKDIYGAEGPEGKLLVTMPRNRATYNSLFLKFLERFPLLERLLNFL